MDSSHHTPSAFRRTLANALKRLFKSVKTQDADNQPSAPVDIIRKDVSGESHLPRISEVSLFPNFEELSVNNEPTDGKRPLTRMPLESSNTSQVSQNSLLPVKSLSHFNLREVYSDQSGLSVAPISNSEEPHARKLVKNDATGEVVPRKPIVVSKKSTLQIRRPESIHVKISDASLAQSSTSDDLNPGLRRRKRSRNLRECASNQPFGPRVPSLTSIAENSELSASKSSLDESCRLVRHFASFCIIDIKAPGCPVSAVSDDLRYIYDIRDRFVLNAQECSELSMDLSVGRDPDGNEVTYVLLFSPLVAPDTETTRFILVSAIDVSGYVRYAASLETNSKPQDNCTSPTSFTERPKRKRKSTRSWIDERTDQLADELLHGCSIKDDPEHDTIKPYNRWQTSRSTSSDFDGEDIWTAIADEEGLIFDKALISSKPIYTTSKPMSSQKQNQTAESADPKITLNYADEVVLGKFIESLQMLYSQYFLLACSPLNDQFYEICYVSPSLYARGEYVSGHLSRMPLHNIRGFGAQLAAGRRFRRDVRWGNEGIEKQLYCVPLTGRQPPPWICMLVDKDTPIHW